MIVEPHGFFRFIRAAYTRGIISFAQLLPLSAGEPGRWLRDRHSPCGADSASLHAAIHSPEEFRGGNRGLPAKIDFVPAIAIDIKALDANGIQRLVEAW